MEQTTFIQDEAYSLFSLNRIMLHNSAKASIVSLDVNVNTYIASGNGEGKTATMNAIQIGFLPWTNFLDSKKKFHFIDSRGNPYQDDESYDFYFPSENSFMLFEFTNPHGTFTQIVYRSNENLGLHRAFVPMKIEDLYSWFWQFDDEAEMDELGKPTFISLSGLKEKLKTVKGVVYAKKIADAKEIMYNGSLTQEEGCYSIANVNKRNVDNLVDIFRLTAKASSITDEKIKSLSISLINNSYINNKRDKLNVKPRELIASFEMLSKESEKLTVRENEKPLFNQITQAFQTLTSSSTGLTNKVATLHVSSSILLKNAADKITLEETKSVALQSKVSQASAHKAALVQRKDELNGELKVEDATAKGAASKISHYEWLRKASVPGIKAGQDQRYKEMSDTHLYESDDVTLEVLREELVENEDSLESFNNTEAKYDNYQKCSDKIKELKSKIASKEASIKRLEESTGIYSSSEIHQPDVLVAINNNFSAVSKDVLDSHADVLNAFSQIFEQIDGGLRLVGDHDHISFGRVKSRDPQGEIDDLQRQIDDLNADLTSYEKRHKQLTEVVVNNDKQSLQAKKEALEYDIKMTKLDIEVIESVRHRYDEHKSQELKVEKLRQEKEILLTQIKEAGDALNATISEKTTCDNKKQEFQNDRQAMAAIISKLKEILSLSGYKIDLDSIKMEGDRISQPTLLHVDEIRQLISTISEVKKSITFGLGVMVEKGIVTDNQNLLKLSSDNFTALRNILYKDLKSKYDGIDEEKYTLSKEITKHTQTTIEISNVLETQMRHYNGVINQLNNTLAGFNITNIDEMRLDMSLSERVKSFIKTIQSMGLESSDVDISDATIVFGHIRRFVDDMDISNGKSFDITAEELIEEIVLQFKVAGRWTTTTGSNGQTLVSTAVLLSLFIEHICGKGIRLAIPINVDEIANVDQNNLLQLAEFMASKNLVLFSASPEISLGHEGIFKNYISFDDSKVYDTDILLSHDNVVVLHYLFGSMYQPTDLEGEFEDFDEDLAKDALDSRNEANQEASE